MPPAKGARATVGNDDRLDDTPIGRKLAQSSGPGRGRRPAASMNNIPAGKELSGPSGAVQTNGKHVPRVTRAQQVSAFIPSHGL
jgi:hypothetical protein